MALVVPGAVAFAPAVPVDCCCCEDCVELTSGFVLDGVATEELAELCVLVAAAPAFCCALPMELLGGFAADELAELGEDDCAAGFCDSDGVDVLVVELADDCC